MKRALIASTVLLALLGCAAPAARIVDVDNKPVSHNNSVGVSMDEVQIDVRMAASRAKWSPLAGSTPGHMTVIRVKENTSATVEITYSLNQFSIKYKDSTGLDYKTTCPEKIINGPAKVGDKCINPIYVEWVNALQFELAKSLQY